MFHQTDPADIDATVAPTVNAADAETATAATDLFEIEVPAMVVDRERLLALRALLAQQRGAIPVRLVVAVPDVGRVVIDISKCYAVRPDPELRRQVELLFTTTRAA